MILNNDNLKRVADKLDPERNDEKKQLREISERQFEVNILVL